MENISYNIYHMAYACKTVTILIIFKLKKQLYIELVTRETPCIYCILHDIYSMFVE